MQCHYLNNAATSYPKPPEVGRAMASWIERPPVDPGRDSGCADDPLSRCRTEVAALLGVPDPDRVVLLPSATHALNLVLAGLLSRSGRVVTSCLEHNSVLRPLAHLSRSRRVDVVVLEPGDDGRLDRVLVGPEINDSTALIVLSHACNVSGAVQPVEDIAGLACEAGIPFLVDASQSAGAIRLCWQELPGRVFVAFAGHKGLLGPPGVGGLVVPDDDLPQLVVGGTGIRSESALHPPELPLRFEAGTPNLPGIAGLAAGVRLVRDRGVEAEGAHRHLLVTVARSELGRVPGVRLLPLPGGDGRAGIVSFTVEGWDPEELAFVLRTSFGIHTRAGLHCAPLAHAFYRTAPAGTVRASFGRDNDHRDVEALVAAIRSVGGA